MVVSLWPNFFLVQFLIYFSCLNSKAARNFPLLQYPFAIASPPEISGAGSNSQFICAGLASYQY